MKNIKNSCLSLLTLAAFFACVSSSAAVKSRSVEVDVVENDKQVGKKVIVTCRRGDEKREIFKEKGGRMWCDKSFPEMCAKLKGDLSDRVCSSRYRNKLASLQQQTETDKNVEAGNLKAELEAELMEIEQKRIDIADKVLELKKRELELQKTLS